MNSPAVLQAATIVFIGSLIVATITDIVWLRIPNWIPACIALLFLVAAVAEPRSLAWWGSHLGAGGIVLLVGMGVFAWGKIGGGDVKLMTAVALWFGLSPLPALLLAIGVVGGGVSIACVVLRGVGSGAMLEYLGLRAVALETGQGVPYAVAIAVGCWLMAGGLLT
ncbi:MAG: prepilin peptidase [Acetobacteraceae bacterium]|jgi:prepilin peptidase CpaA